ncbi:MAG: GHKL domain-containing protein [Clostridiales bacterium]|nr:GHKL domain-containing protein [Clostridiales bacterium]
MLSNALNVILQIIEGLITFTFYESINNSAKKIKIKNSAIIIISYIIMCVINLTFEYNSLVNAIVLCAFQFFFALILYKEKPLFSLMYAIIIVCLVGTTELVAINIISAANGNPHFYKNDDNLSYFIHILISKSLLLVSLQIISSIINKFKTNEKFNFILLAYPVSMLLEVIILSIVSYEENLSDKSRALVAVSSFILIIPVILINIVQQSESRKEKELLELKSIYQEQQLNETYFELLEHQNEELQTFVHDTKKHYKNLYDILDNTEQAQKYIEEIINDLDTANRIGKSSNKLLDLIINNYNYICKKNNIDFIKSITNTDLYFIADNDLTSIFNNLLDNAVEAAAKSHKKTVSLNVSRIEDMFILDIVNSCDTKPIVKNGRLISAKPNKEFHGLGFKSVLRCIKKYDGDLAWKYDDTENQFSVSIIFNVN